MPPKGSKLSDESRKKVSEAKMGIRFKYICCFCGKEFERIPSRVKRGEIKYCSQSCYHKDRIGKPHIESVKRTTSWNKGIKTPIEIRIKMSNSHKGKKRPLEVCTHISEGKKGKKHPMFGKAVPLETRIKMVESQLGGFWYGNVRYYDGQQYCEKWNEDLRIRIRAFFNNTCQKCGHVWQPGEKKLSCHHVHYRKDACCASDFKPMFVAVCAENGCHSSTNSNREFWTKYFEDKINNEYGGQSYYSKEEWADLRST